jgi:WD40 repeat protein
MASKTVSAKFRYSNNVTTTHSERGRIKCIKYSRQTQIECVDFKCAKCAKCLQPKPQQQQQQVTWRAIAYDSGMIELWRNENVIHELNEHSADIHDIAFSVHDRVRLASASEDCTVCIWDIETGKCEYHIKSLPGVADGSITGAMSVTWGKDDQWLAVGYDNHRVYIFDALDWSVICVLQERAALVGPVHFHRPTNALFTCSTDVFGFEDRDITVWDTATWTKTARLRCHIDSVTDLSCTADGSLLASICQDGQVAVWNVHTFKLVQKFKLDSIGFHVAFSRSDDVLACADGGWLKFWSRTDWKLIQEIEVKSASTNLCCLSFKPDGTEFAVAIEGYSTHQIWSYSASSAMMSVIFPSRNHALKSKLSPITNPVRDASASAESGSDRAALIDSFFDHRLFDINVLRIIRRFV